MNESTPVSDAGLSAAMDVTEDDIKRIITVINAWAEGEGDEFEAIAEVIGAATEALYWKGAFPEAMTALADALVAVAEMTRQWEPGSLHLRIAADRLMGAARWTRAARRVWLDETIDFLAPTSPTARPWSEEELRRFLAMHDRPIADIARELGRDAEDVQLKWDEPTFWQARLR